VVHRNLGDMKLVLNQLVYEKGGWILHMLRDTVGQDAFWNGMREYYRRFRDRNASTDDLRQVFEQVSGKSLKPFFTQWLTRPGTPRLEGTWRYDPERKAVEVTVLQTQGGEPFTFPLDVAVMGAMRETPVTVRLTVDQGRVTGTIPVPFVPASVTLDPATTLLAEVVSFGQR
jgi:aminopeptidase N